MAVTLSLIITPNGQSIEDAASNVTVKAVVDWTNGSWNLTGKCTGSMTIDGIKYSWSGLTFNSARTNSGSKTIMTKTVNVSHNDDGTKTLTCSAVFVTGVSSGTVTAAKSIVLETIPRATTPDFSVSKADMGEVVIIRLPRASDFFTHNLAYMFIGESEYTEIATGVGTSYVWTIPDKSRNLPDSTKGDFTVRVETVSDGAVIGTTYGYITGVVPSSVVPTVQTVVVSENTSGLTEQFGIYIQNKSEIKIDITAAGASGSSVMQYETMFQNTAFYDSSFTLRPTTSGTFIVKTRVRDSRGRWSEYTKTSITVVEYTKPKIAQFKVFRVDQNSAPDDSGVYLGLSIDYSVPTLNGGNTATMVVQYKKSTESTWSNAILDSSATSYAEDKTISAITFSTDYQYDIRMTVTDWFGEETTANDTLLSAKVILDLAANGLGFAIGKTSERDGIEIGWKVVGSGRNFESLAGQYRTYDGLLLQWGAVAITPSAPDIPTSAAVSFLESYATAPIILITPLSDKPQFVSVSTQPSNDNKSMVITLSRSSVAATSVLWLAIGKGVDT